MALILPPNESAVTLESRGWLAWFSQATDALNSIRQSGTTAQRPTAALWVGRSYFDTTLGLPVVYDGTSWIDYAGNPV